MADEIDDIPQQAARPKRERTWPREAPGFRAIERVGKIYIPLTRELASEPIEAKPIGTPVARGERLTSVSPEATHAAVTPLAGRIVGVEEIALLNGNRAQAGLVGTGLPDVRPTSSSTPAPPPTPHPP